MAKIQGWTQIVLGILVLLAPWISLNTQIGLVVLGILVALAGIWSLASK
mgnify:CR=1 FL=1